MKTNLLSMASVRILICMSMLLGMVFPPGATAFAGVQHALDEKVADSLFADLAIESDSESESIASIQPQAAARPDLQEQTTSTPPATTTDAPPPTPTPSDTGTPIPSSSVTETDTPPDTPEATESPATTEEITSTPSETATDIPSPTSTPSEIPLTLILETAEEAIMPGESLTITYTIEGWAGLESTENLELAITMPEGIRPHGRDAKEWDQKTLTLRVPVESETGEFEWKIAPNAEGPFAIAAQLLQDEVVLAGAKLQLGDRSLFELSASGGEIDGLDGRVRIKFPKQAVRQDLKVRVRKAGKYSDIPDSLSGHPVEIIATRANSRALVEKFPASFTLEMYYEDDEIHGDESSLTIFYYSKKDKGWVPMVTMVDTEANVMSAEVDHLSVFDFNTQDWEAARLPTLDNFQVAGYTGAGTYSLPIEVPAGPGGLQPNLVLSYNSQVVDGANNYTQADWVGMGWSLDTGYIQRNMNGTNDYQDDDTFSLTVNGMGGLLLPVGEGTDSRGDYVEYQTADHSFMRIRHYPIEIIDGYPVDNSFWLVWDKTGNLYEFIPGPFYPDIYNHCVEQLRRWQWPLHTVTNVHGQKIIYNYAYETKYADVGCGGSEHKTAVYPSEIYYPNFRYRIVFNRIDRYDYDGKWRDYASYRILFKRSLLGDIRIEHDSDGNGTYDELIRKYVFTYASDPEDLIFPNIEWDPNIQGVDGGDTPTLIQVQEFGLGGSEALPPYTFEYGDHMHLTRADNGYGGVIEFEYDAWNADETNDEGKEKYRGGSDPIYQDEIELPDLELDVYYPGSNYRFTGDVNGYVGGHANFGIEIDDENTEIWSADVPFGHPGSDWGWEVLDATLTVPGDATKVLPLFGCTFCGLNNLKMQVMPTRYRVVEKRLYDGINASPIAFNYEYGGGAMNDEEHSDGVSTDYPYYEEHTQFRGHEWSSVIALDDLENKILETKTWYYQDDILKGKPYKTEVRDDQGNLYNWSNTHYLSDEYPTSDLPEDEDHHTYTDLKIYWTRMDFEKSRRYEGDSDFVETHTGYSYSTSFQGGAQYGNVVSVVEYMWNGSTYVVHRVTNTLYYPRDDDGAYIVGLPGYRVVGDEVDWLISLQLYYYDGETNVTIPPANGVLTATKTQIDDTHFTDTVFTYDSWGNQDSVTQYSEYSTDVWAFPSAESAQTTTTTYDPVYHTYPISTTNAEGHAVTWDYNWALGLPISETGPNGGTTTAVYDAFGRLTGITRPGDSDTISISYYDSASPYRVEITERLDADTTTTSRRFYDGLGRKIQTQADDVELEAGTRDVVVDMRYDEYGRLVEQTVPYAITNWNGEFEYKFDEDPITVSTTVTSYDILSRPLTVIAPDNTPDNPSVSYAYDDLLVSVTDAKGHTTTQHMDVWGHLIQVDPPDGPSASYAYDKLDRLTSVTSGGATTTIEYDMAGRKTSMDDADMGAWSYQYDALGNLTQQTDARGCITELEYDSLNRLTGKDYSGPGECDDTPDVDFTYDEGNYGLGQRTGMSDGSGSTTWTYDQRGRLIEEEKVITDSGTFVTTWTYNTSNQITSMTYPGGPNGESGETVTYDYLDQGAFDSLTGDSSYGNPTYVASSSYDEAGRLTTRTLGSGLLETSYDYYAWTAMGGRLQQMTTERLGDQTILQNLEYSYDAVGNVEWIKDWVAGSPQTQSYTYDNLDRLTDAVVTGGSGGLYDESYSYDPITGNMASKAGVNYGYQGAQPHAVTHLDGQEFFAYDAIGNMIERVVGDEATFLTYDAESRLIAAESAPAEPAPEPTVVELEPVADAWIAEYAGGESLVPIGTIALFTDSCPVDWERYSEMDGRFPRGAETAGGTGGSETHTHTYAEIPAHTHEAGTLATSVDGSHRHSLHFKKPGTGGSSPYPSGATAAGDWVEGVVSDAGAHSHDIEGETASTGVSDAQTEASSNMPPYLEMVFCEKVVSDQAELPVGAILLYDDSLPQAWADFAELDGFFPIGSETYGATGGAEEHTHIYHDVPEHSHEAGELVTTIDGEHSHDIRLNRAAGGNNPYPNGGMNPGSWYGNNVSTNGAHTHTISGETASTGVADPQTEATSSLPPYLDVVFAEKSASDGLGIPQDGIAMFDGVCPLGWTRVSDLDDRFPRGASTYGATGGSETHYHAYSEVPAHTHDVGTLSTVSAGAHTHELHWHGSGGGSAPYLGGGMSPGSNWYSAPVSYDGEHSHDLTGQTAGSGGTDLETDSTSILPPYSDIIFCKNTAPAQSAGNGTGTELQIGNNSSVGTTSRGVLRWDLSSVPEDVTIVSAEIEMHVLGDESENERSIRAYRLIPPWNEASVTWGTPWVEGGAEGVTDVHYSFGPTASGWTPITGDWDGDGVDTIGLFDPATNKFYLRNTHAAGEADVYFQFGPTASGWTPITGDWDGDGVDTIGLYDLATARFHLRNSNSGGVADISFIYGAAGSGWAPITGDWDGDGVDTIGLYDPGAARFHLRNSNSGGVADISFIYGPAGSGWTPITGDWDGDGVDTIGLYDPDTARFHLRNTNSGGVADISFIYGPAGSGWTPIAGDWEDDGVDKIGLFDHATNKFFLRNMHAAGAADRELEEAGSGTVPADPSGSVIIDLDPVKVAQMLHGTWEDQGFVLEVEVETDDLVRYHSRESAQAQLRPVLHIAYRETNNQFVYDGDGNRVLTIIDGVTTAYPGDHYEYEVSSEITRQYYDAGGTRVAMRVSGDPEPSENGVFYTLGDHLGSTSLTVDESGTVVAELRYKAWGEIRYAAGDTPTTWRYTGQRQEDGLGLYYYRARWYDPALGRFIQADTIVPNPANPLSINRYTYVSNNPIKFSDPSGHRECLDTDSNGRCIEYGKSQKSEVGSKGKISPRLIIEKISKTTATPTPAFPTPSPKGSQPSGTPAAPTPTITNTPTITSTQPTVTPSATLEPSATLTPTDTPTPSSTPIIEGTCNYIGCGTPNPDLSGSGSDEWVSSAGEGIMWVIMEYSIFDPVTIEIYPYEPLDPFKQIAEPNVQIVVKVLEIVFTVVGTSLDIYNYLDENWRLDPIYPLPGNPVPYQ